MQVAPSSPFADPTSTFPMGAKYQVPTHPIVVNSPSTHIWYSSNWIDPPRCWLTPTAGSRRSFSLISRFKQIPSPQKLKILTSWWKLCANKRIWDTAMHGGTAVIIHWWIQKLLQLWHIALLAASAALTLIRSTLDPPMHHWTKFTSMFQLNLLHFPSPDPANKVGNWGELQKKVPFWTMHWNHIDVYCTKCLWTPIIIS